jgi:outer membrane receptor protein involved in Fe transport
MLRRFLFNSLIALALVVLGAGVSLSQATGGSIAGQVADANGAAVPNATVTLRNEANGQTLTAQTAEAGSYSFPNVLVGNYTVTIEAQGFQTATQKVVVALSNESSVNTTLQVAGLNAETVDVSGGSEALVQTENSQLGRNFEERQVQDLPIFNDPRSLALLSPNVVAQGAGVGGDGGSVGGTRPNSNTFNVDGVDNNDPSVTGRQLEIIQDAISEVAILTNNYNAEFGTGAGGQFNTVTKSGTNEYHGSGFLYFQSQRLNATTSAEEAAILRGDLLEKPQLKQPRYGGTFGGPILKNKLFFFGAYQRTDLTQQGSGVSYTAPTSAGLAQIEAIPGVSPFVAGLLRDNLTLANNAAETRTVLGVSGIPFGQVSVVNPNDSLQTQYQLNIDYLRGERDQFRFRYSQDDVSQQQPGNGNVKFNNSVVQPVKLFSAGWIRLFTPNLVNELRLSYKRFQQNFVLDDPAFETFPNLTVPDLNLGLGPNGNLPQGGFDNSYQVYDAVSLTRGSHALKFGAEGRFLIFTSFFLPRGRGDYVYANLDELLLDRAPSVVDLRGVGSSAFTGNQQKFYAFAQDDWKVTPNLTLNLGLRYEYLSMPRDASLQALNSIADLPGVIEFRVPRTDKNNFAPRVGLAYSPEFGGRLGRLISGKRGQSAIRANFSISYYEIFQNLYLLNLPPQFQQESSAAELGLTNSFLQNGGVPPTPLPPLTTAAARSATASFITDAVMPYNMAWTLSYQRELTPGTVMELRYLHTAGRHLPVQVRLNGGVVDNSRLVIPTFLSNPTAAQLAGRPTLGEAGLDVAFPRRLGAAGFAGSVTSFEPEGNSVYDGASVSLTRRFAKRLAFTAAYTWSKAIDNATNELFSSTVNPRRAQNVLDLSDERSLSAVDVPHRFVASLNYETPTFRKHNGFVRAVLGGWQVSGIFQTQSGQLITPQSGIDSNRDRDAAGDRTILNLNGVPGTGSGVFPVDINGNRLTVTESGVTRFVDASEGDARTVAYVALNPNAQYIQAGLGARANAGRNTLRTNDWNRTDAVFLKNFRFGGENRYTFQFGAEIGNLFNQRIRTIGDYGSPFFVNQNDFNGTNQFGIGAVSFAFPDVTSPNFNDYSVGNFSGRTIQLRAKFVF